LYPDLAKRLGQGSESDLNQQFSGHENVQKYTARLILCDLVGVLRF
jgi:hypothetical protein